MKPTIGIGIIGTGFGSAVHLPGFKTIKGVRVIGIASQNSDKARRIAEENKLPQKFKNWRQLIASPDIDAVAISTPPYLHAPMALAALARGKSVLCEKPMARTAREAAAMLKAARKKKVAHMMDFEFREIPAFAAAKKILDQKKIGTIRHCQIKWMVQSWADPSRPWTWRAQRSKGGGTLGALAVHSIDYIEWMLGPIVEVSARLDTLVQRRPYRGRFRRVETEDSCHLMFRLKNGALVSAFVTAAAPVNRGHWIEVIGEKGILSLGSSRSDDYGKGFELTLVEPRSGARKISFPSYQSQFSDGRIAPFVRIAQNFVKAVRNKKSQVEPSFVQGYRSQLVLDAALKSHREGKPISV